MITAGWPMRGGRGTKNYKNNKKNNKKKNLRDGKEDGTVPYLCIEIDSKRLSTCKKEENEFISF